jgi:hypothetical protein
MFQKPRIFVALWIWFIGEAAIRFSGQRKTSPAHEQVEGGCVSSRLKILLTIRVGTLNCEPLLGGVVAQLVEHHNGIVGVRSSNLLGSTIQRCDSYLPDRFVLLNKVV